MDKQIEEMARVLCSSWKHMYDSCEKCSEKLCCAYYNVAEELVDAGYRKIPEGAVVLTREEHQRYLAYKIIEPKIRGCLDREEKLEKQVRELDKELNLAKSVLSYDDERPLEKWAEHLRKETAEKFAERLSEEDCSIPIKDDFIIITRKDIDEICKEFTEGRDEKG
jgi:hypothetical protein